MIQDVPNNSDTRKKPQNGERQNRVTMNGERMSYQNQINGRGRVVENNKINIPAGESGFSKLLPYIIAGGATGAGAGGIGLYAIFS